MSLYGGIKFTSIPNVNGEKQQSNEQSSSQAQAQAQAQSLNQSQASSSSSSSTGTHTNEPKPQIQKPGEWSAALKFAPRVNKPKPAPATTRPSGFTSSIASAPTPTTGLGSESGVTESRVDTIRSAEPIITIAPTPGAGVGLSTLEQNEDEIQFGPDGLPLAKAPAMILDTKGKRGREGDDKKKKKKKKRKNNFQPLLPTFDPEEQYDPNRPNDLGEYQQYRKKLREERRIKLLEERRRKAQGLSSGESSYYTDSEDDAPRRDAPKMFAPPKIYNESASTNKFPPPPSIAAPSASGDDAYARRAALSSQPASSDDAYARRAALSQNSASGDDAYARRIAMSQGVAPPSFAPSSYAPAPPSFQSPQSPRPPPSFAPPSQSSFDMPSNASSSDIPGFGLSSSSSAPVPTPSISNAEKDDFAKMLEERKKAAEAIAAKFKALAGGGQSAPSLPVPPVNAPILADTEDSGNGTFAEKMMRKWGHQEGSTLGIRNEGLLHALTAEHVTNQPQLKPGEQLSKRQLAKQKAAAANAKNRKWVQATNARGRIVNANEDARLVDQRGKKGEESRVICLVGLVGSVDEVDEELSDEIGEECSKHGIVERVVLHMVEPPPPEPEECLRIFVVFSGMAGAWRAIKELDGRFFGGRKIRVTYFDEARFDRGDRDGEIL
ncbi:uncharacterized protein IL334_003227 [Kwoniella shivajii]|uniref:RRM domain-containing protein n=1 Tax=Kwoniella shivajii TaxID=564305 RepID=A0ABZ1CYP6_9TREE|nr:hypothetical protein IL334_003227 [Kwoniella shivajii]